MTSTSSAPSSFTPSLALAYGPSPLVSPDGPTIGRSGRGAAPVKVGPPLVNGRASKTHAISGRISFGSSPPVGPLSSWVKSLRDRLSTRGSTELHLTWKVSVTPAGRSIYRLAPSTPRTGETGSGGSHWPTPRVAGSNGNSPSGVKHGDLKAVICAQWPTPTVADIEGGRKTRSGPRNDEMLLNGLMAQWATPRVEAARDFRSDRSKMSSEELYGTKGRPLARQITEASGWTPSGFNAPMEKRGAPDPRFASWLMGWSEELTSGALLAIQSYLNSQRKSSKRSKTKSIPANDLFG